MSFKHVINPSPISGTIACSREVFFCELLGYLVTGKNGVARKVIKSGAPNVDFRKIYVRKTI